MPVTAGSATAAVRLAAYVVVAYLLFSITGVVVNVVLLVVGGLLVAVFLDGAATGIASRTRIPRKAALALVCLAIMAATVGFWIMVLPSLTSEVESLGEKLPLALDRLGATFGQEGWGKSLIEQVKHADEHVGAQTLRNASSAARVVVGGLGSAALVLFIGLFVAVGPGEYRRGLLRLVPVHRRSRIGEVMDAVVVALQRWLLATLFATLVVGVLTFTGLTVLGMPLAFSLAVLAALMTFIPNVGPVLAAIPAILLGLLDSTTAALLVAGLYLVIQLLETYVITPLLQQKLLSLPPALILVAQAVMGALGGIVGVVVATPLTLISIVVIEKLYVEDKLERGTELEPAGQSREPAESK